MDGLQEGGVYSDPVGSGREGRGSNVANKARRLRDEGMGNVGGSKSMTRGVGGKETAGGRTYISVSWTHVDEIQEGGA